MITMSPKKSPAANRGSRSVQVRIPETLHRLLIRAAKAEKKTAQALILAMLGERFGVEVREPKVGRPRSSED